MTSSKWSIFDNFLCYDNSNIDTNIELDWIIFKKNTYTSQDNSLNLLLMSTGFPHAFRSQKLKEMRGNGE